MEKQKNCVFCDGLVETEGQIFVCNKCEVVLFAKGFSSEEIRQRITDYLSDIQSKILSKRNYLYILKEKANHNHSLSPEEKEICDNLQEFQSVCEELCTLF